MLYATDHQYNPVVDYLNGTAWDGTPRLDTLLVDYLGAEDTPYVRAVTRKALVACVARAFVPGIKFDTMLVLVCLKQGIGKSTFFRVLSNGWFCDSVYTLDGKVAQEQIQGVWIVEMAELQALRKADDARVRQLVAQSVDRFREAYGHRAQDYPRRCVFFGTGNDRSFLKDKTGNRRFWPVDVNRQPPTKNVFQALAQERDQIWAEAVMRFRLGEDLYLKGAMEEAAIEAQEAHMEDDPQEGRTRDFIERPVPQDWINWPLERRRMFWAGAINGPVEMVPRDKVCALEVWSELLEKLPGDMTNRDAAIINARIARCEGWEPIGTGRKFAQYCGQQRGFRKLQTTK